jgi:rhodanese-related sulfurtransferase
MTPDTHDSPRADLDAATFVLSIGVLGADIESVLAGSTIVTTTNLFEQLDRQFPTAVVDTTMFGTSPERLRAAIHTAVQHLEPGGRLVLTGAVRDTPMVHEFELGPAHEPADSEFSAVDGVIMRRTARFTVHDMLFEARRMIERIEPAELDRRRSGPTPPVVVDTRTHVDRLRQGVIPGAIHVPRTVVEWHLDPANGYLHPAITSLAQPLVVVCNGGYASSLAAANLLRIGYGSVADLIGGHHAWCAAGLPVTPPDHSHLDL